MKCYRFHQIRAITHNWNALECFQLLTVCVINYTLNCTSKIPNAHNYMHSTRMRCTYTCMICTSNEVHKNRFTFCIHFTNIYLQSSNRPPARFARHHHFDVIFPLFFLFALLSLKTKQSLLLSFYFYFYFS